MSDLIKTEGHPKEYKTNSEIVQELIDVVFDAISKETGANMIMLRPALNIAKLKISQMTEEDSANIVDQVHKISRHIEIETGVYSPYHGTVN